MDPEILSIIGERKKYDYLIIPKKERLTTKMIPLVRQIYKRTIKELYDTSKKEVTVIGYLEGIKPKIKKSDQELLKSRNVSLESVSKYSIFAETSSLQTNAFVFAEPHKIQESYLPGELSLERLSENTFYLKDCKPTYMRCEGLEIEAPSFSYNGIIRQLSKYSRLSSNSERHILNSLAFPYIGCKFCANIADGFGVAHLSIFNEDKALMENIRNFHENLNCNKLGIPFNHFGILNLIGEKNLPLIDSLRIKMRNKAQNISWLNTCSKEEENLLKLSELKYCSEEPIFYENSYKDIKSDLDLRYSLLMFSIKPKKEIGNSLWNKGLERSYATLKGYAKTFEEKKTLYGYIVDQKSIPLLIGRVLSLSSAVNLSNEDSLNMLDKTLINNIDEVADKISKKAVSEEVYAEVDPKIIFAIVTSEDKNIEGLVKAIQWATDYTDNECRHILQNLINDCYIVKKGKDYLYLGYSDFNIESAPEK